MLFNCPVTSDSLRSHGLQRASPPCPSPSPEVARVHVHVLGASAAVFSAARGQLCGWEQARAPPAVPLRLEVRREACLCSGLRGPLGAWIHGAATGGPKSRAWPGLWGPAGFRKLRPRLALQPCGVRPGPGPLELGSQAQAAPPGSGGVAGALEPLLTSEKANFSFWLCF